MTRKKPPLSHQITKASNLDVVYKSTLGAQLAADSLELLRTIEPNSVDLIITSPPFALLRKKEYGNEDQDEYVSWLTEFGKLAMPALKESGSFVIDLGGAYRKGAPVRSLYNYRVLLQFVDDLGYHLAEEFFWYNPAKIPSPAEWVNKRKIRVTDAVNTIWWFSKTEYPKADTRKVRVPYSAAMESLLRDPEGYYKVTQRPSEHEITEGFGKDNGGALPRNLLQLANTESNSFYMRTVRALGERTHPARFPAGLPKFFITYLTDPGDLVIDIFSGSNTTGRVAEDLGRQWIACELHRPYAELSAIRFMEGKTLDEIAELRGASAAGTTLDL